jgi:hypothetical protein
LNHCSVRCVSCNHTAGGRNGASATADFFAPPVMGRGRVAVRLRDRCGAPFSEPTR